MNHRVDLCNISLPNGYSFDFEYPIHETLEINSVIVIVLDIPPDITYNQNVFAITNSGDFLWRIKEIDLFYWERTSCPYVGVIINYNGELVLFNWCDTALIVDPQTGEVLSKYQTK